MVYSIIRLIGNTNAFTGITVKDRKIEMQTVIADSNRRRNRCLREIFIGGNCYGICNLGI